MKRFLYYYAAIVFLFAFNLYQIHDVTKLDTAKAHSRLSSSQYNNKCPKNFAESLIALTSNLQSDPENGLRPLNLTIPTPSEEGVEKKISFPGLDTAFFSNKRIVFIGDSTGRYLFGYLQVLIHDNLCKEYNSSILDDVQKMSLSDANHHLFKKAELCGVHINSTYKPAHIHPLDNTTIMWEGFGAHVPGTDNILLEQAWKIAENTKPQILIVNHGLHWLHFMNHSMERGRVPILRWMFYEQWLNEVVENALLMSETVEVLLFKTTNSICDKKMFSHLRNAHLFYSLARIENNSTLYTDNDTIKNCQRNVENILKESDNITQDQILEFCLYGTFDDFGSEYLNKRLYHYVITLLSSSSKYKNLPFQVGIFNDRAIESCSYTDMGDGRHYKWLILARLRLLSNILSCTNEWSDNQQWKKYTEFLLHNSTSD